MKQTIQQTIQQTLQQTIQQTMQRTVISLDDAIAESYLAESCEHLATAEADLLALERGGAGIDEELVNRAFRAVHAIKGGAVFFDLGKIGELAHQIEDVLTQIRAGTMVPTPDRVSILLRATDKLLEMLRSPGTSNQADNSGISKALNKLLPDESSRIVGNSSAAESGPERKHSAPLRVLLVEDDFASRLLLQTFLSRYGECHMAVNGREAVEAFRVASERGQPYELICMDIQMPEMDGREAVRQIRAMEEAKGTRSSYGAKIIMTTTVRDIREVILCFRELCDSYLMKPIDLGELLSKMKSFQLVQ